MNESIRNYYVLNQLLNSKPLRALPSEVTEGLDMAQLAKYESAINQVTAPLPSELARTILNFLRSSDYAITFNNAGVFIPIGSIADMCREQGLDPAGLSQWIVNCIEKVETISGNANIALVDGTLRIPESYLDGGDLEAVVMHAISEAFTLFVWGTYNPTDKQKELVSKLLAFANVEDPFSLKDKELMSVVGELAASGLHVPTLMSSVINIPDLQYVYEFTGALLWELDSKLDAVKLMLPTGRQKQACVKAMSLENILLMAEDSPKDISKFVYKGQHIVKEAN